MNNSDGKIEYDRGPIRVLGRCKTGGGQRPDNEHPLSGLFCIPIASPPLGQTLHGPGSRLGDTEPVGAHFERLPIGVSWRSVTCNQPSPGVEIGEPTESGDRAGGVLLAGNARRSMPICEGKGLDRQASQTVPNAGKPVAVTMGSEVATSRHPNLFNAGARRSGGREEQISLAGGGNGR